MYEHVRALKPSTFDLKNSTILNTDINQFEREFSEMLHIDSTDFTLNRKTDIHILITSYRNFSRLVRNVPKKPSCNNLNFPSSN